MRINEVADSLHERFGRPPTTEEVHDFIMGDHAQRIHIWNFGRSAEE